MTASSRSKRAARLGVFAILFQAILFGWHHHDLPLAACCTSLALSAPASGGTGFPAEDADECAICIVLHHQAATPLAFMVAPMPVGTASVVYRSDLAVRGRGAEPAFQARAPPRA